MELLWSLNCIDSDINSIRRSIKKKDIVKHLNEISDNYNEIKKVRDTDEKKYNVNEKKISKLNLDLKCLEDKLKDLDLNLYKQGQNLKIIDNVQKEIETCTLKRDETENEILMFMEMDEKLVKDIEERTKVLSERKSEFDELKANYVEKAEKSKMEIESLNVRRESIVKEVDEKLLKQYNDIASKRMNALSKVEGDLCTECGVRMNAMLLDALKKKNSICLCEHCGRILYAV